MNKDGKHNRMIWFYELRSQMRDMSNKLGCLELRFDSVSGLVQDVSRHLSTRIMDYVPEWDVAGESYGQLKVWFRIELDAMSKTRGMSETSWQAF